jgi:hypothetical protein
MNKVVRNSNWAGLVFSSQNGATKCSSELTIYKNGEVHCWDRAYDDDGNQVKMVSSVLEILL